MPKYYIWTVGCQMNKAESERLGDYLEGLGYQAADEAAGADFIAINSCVVRQSAESRVLNKLNALKALKKAHPDLMLAVTGCLVDSDIDHLQKSFPHVASFFKPGDLPRWLEKQDTSRPYSASAGHFSPSTFVPIIQGCNNFCSYCIVPYRRGREKSRPVTDIINEVRELVRSGVTEITLLGQTVDSYGHDLPDRPDLVDLLTELNTLNGLARIRFLTNHTKDMSSRLIEAVASLDKVCEQVSLPVQSGDDDILEAMGRGYTVEQYQRLITDIRTKITGVALSTDVIVGFPSESEQQFQRTVDLLAGIRFDSVHVAAYSPRPGTMAARELEDNIPLSEKKERVNKIEQLQEEIAAETNSRLLGKGVEVLIETKEKGKWQGRTRTGKLVFFPGDGDYLGQLVDVRIEKTSPWALQGKIATDND